MINLYVNEVQTAWLEFESCARCGKIVNQDGDTYSTFPIPADIIVALLGGVRVKIEVPLSHAQRWEFVYSDTLVDQEERDTIKLALRNCVG
jgi:hypothetical protein